MILTRPGNKRRIAQSILPLFPEHDLFIDLFFGAGGMFFSKPKARHNIVNDYDSEVYNLFRVIMDRKEELIDVWRMVPVHEDLLKYWRKNHETDPVRKAARFLFMSNLSFMGQMSTLIMERCNRYHAVEQRVDAVQEAIRGVKFMNCDFRKVLSKISFGPTGKDKSFIYADPPYCETKGGNYDSFTIQDTTDLFDCLQASGCRFAVSEFDHPYLLQLASERKLTVHLIGERQNMKNRRMEILIANY